MSDEESHQSGGDPLADAELTDSDVFRSDGGKGEQPAAYLVLDFEVLDGREFLKKHRLTFAARPEALVMMARKILTKLG